MHFLSMILLVLTTNVFAGRAIFTEFNNGDMGAVYKITKDGRTLSKLWAKYQLDDSHPSIVVDPKFPHGYDDKALDPENPKLISKESESRKACLELGGDLPTTDDYIELVEAVVGEMDVLALKFPGIEIGYSWTSNINVMYGVAWMFGRRSEYRMGYPYDLMTANRYVPFSIRCVVEL